MKPTPNFMSHNPPPGTLMFSEAIIQVGALMPLHSFAKKVLDYFNLSPLQLTSNYFCTIATFYILFIEVSIGEPSAKEFAFVYCIKSLSKHVGFYYTSNRSPNIEGVWGV